MRRIQYAVVRSPADLAEPYSTFKNYTPVWYSSKEDAIDEAKCLARKEHDIFLIVKAIGYAEPETKPVKHELWE